MFALEFQDACTQRESLRQIYETLKEKNMKLCKKNMNFYFKEYAFLWEKKNMKLRKKKIEKKTMGFHETETWEKPEFLWKKTWIFVKKNTKL